MGTNLKISPSPIEITMSFSFSVFAHYFIIQLQWFSAGWDFDPLPQEHIWHYLETCLIVTVVGPLRALEK